MNLAARSVSGRPIAAVGSLVLVLHVEITMPVIPISMGVSMEPESPYHIYMRLLFKATKAMNPIEIAPFISINVVEAERPKGYRVG